MPAHFAALIRHAAQALCLAAAIFPWPHSTRAAENGLKEWLAQRGVTVAATYAGEVLGNVSGGLARGAVNAGKLDLSLGLDLEKIAGAPGLSFFGNVFVIHNSGRIGRDHVDGVNAISNIEAMPDIRLSELWLEQKFGEAAALRIGQLAADAEFFVSDVGAMFIASGWPTIFATSMPNAGPAYPLAAPGVRLKLQLQDFTALIDVFDGDPTGPGPADPQIKNRYGLAFRLRDPPLVMAEGQYRYSLGAGSAALSGIAKLGGWTHFGDFDDQRFGADGLPLADPASTGIARRLAGNSGVYAALDQQIYRPAGAPAESGLFVYGRASASPSDRNLISFFADGGLVAAGMLPGRPNDRFGVSIVHARYSDGARGYDRDLAALTGIATQIRDWETNLEITYEAQLAPNWTLQPDFQYVWHPGGRAGNDAVILAVRTILKY